ncbi:MAG TPA: sensor protein KdpD [Flavilitoribacter sp.]|nr:sensor protein KdpD [Flavilitoribacter sp.]
MDPDHIDHFIRLIRSRRQGRLKVYLGMIAGVGKTYRMLQEAHDLIAAGIDVQIGLIEPHEREETWALMEGIPAIPLKKVYYKGHELQELDLEAIILARPEVVLVDELAHTNIPGCKHEKRWQDVVEILRNGINVITAFNVQHLESMHDKIEKIAGIKVEETVPDRFMAHADEVVNIDLPAEDLIKRMREGKIYKGSLQIARALENYFQPEKILQLRDLALRKVASQLEKKMEKDLPPTGRIHPERFLGCISTNHEGGKKIIRKTARLADHYQAEWYVLYVKTPREETNRIDLKTQRKLLENFKLAGELGGKVITVPSDDIPGAIFERAAELNITNIVTGRPTFSIWRQLTGKNYFDRLLKRLLNTEIDIIIVF